MNKLHGAMLVVAALAFDASASDALVHLEIHEPALDGRRALDLRVDEVERNATDSIIEVVLVSGASVPSSMFVMKAACAVTNARGAHAFRSEPIAGPTTRYRLTFPSDATTHSDDGGRPDGVTVEQCRLVGF